jgi:hypothetical protein
VCVLTTTNSGGFQALRYPGNASPSEAVALGQCKWNAPGEAGKQRRMSCSASSPCTAGCSRSGNGRMFQTVVPRSAASDKGEF